MVRRALGRGDRIDVHVQPAICGGRVSVAVPDGHPRDSLSNGRTPRRPREPDPEAVGRRIVAQKRHEIVSLLFLNQMPEEFISSINAACVSDVMDWKNCVISLSIPVSEM